MRQGKVETSFCDSHTYFNLTLIKRVTIQAYYINKFLLNKRNTAIVWGKGCDKITRKTPTLSDSLYLFPLGIFKTLFGTKDKGGNFIKILHVFLVKNSLLLNFLRGKNNF